MGILTYKKDKKVLTKKIKEVAVLSLKGEVSEWSIVSDSKSDVRESGPGVRIPPSPRL